MNEIPTVIYGVKSSPDEKESVSDQQRIVREAIDREGSREVVGVYGESNQSGFNKERGPALEAAISAATEAATEDQEAELWVFHSSRLARGDGRRGRRGLGKIVHDLLYENVVVRSVTDNEFVTPMLAGIGGTANNKFSEDLSAHITRGLDAAARRGDPSLLAKGVLLGGYLIERTLSERGQVTRRAVKHPDGGWIYELIFEMARDGKSDQSIQLALSERGARTRPTTRNAKSKPFDANLIAGIVTNPAYAALVRHKGEVVGPGQWPAYISPDDFWRVQRDREARAAQTKRPRGRPAGYVTAGFEIDPATGKRKLNLVQPAPYLLGSMATCALCGGQMRGKTSRRQRKGGERVRRYVCLAHEIYHKDSAEFCAALPVPADAADRLVLRAMDSLVADAESFRAQLDAGRAVTVERLGKTAAEAREEAAKADRVAQKAQERYAKALAEDDDVAAEIALDVVRAQRADAQAARTRLDAALDALNAPQGESDGDVLARVWAALSGQLADAGGDVRRLNAALREWFVAFDLREMERAGLRVVPVMSVAALARMMGTPRAFSDDQVSAVGYGPDGEQNLVWGAHLCTTGYSAAQE